MTTDFGKDRKDELLQNDSNAPRLIFSMSKLRLIRKRKVCNEAVKFMWPQYVPVNRCILAVTWRLRRRGTIRKHLCARSRQKRFGVDSALARRGHLNGQPPPRRPLFIVRGAFARNGSSSWTVHHLAVHFAPEVDRCGSRKHASPPNEPWGRVCYASRGSRGEHCVTGKGMRERREERNDRWKESARRESKRGGNGRKEGEKVDGERRCVGDERAKVNEGGGERRTETERRARKREGNRNDGTRMPVRQRSRGHDRRHNTSGLVHSSDATYTRSSSPCPSVFLSLARLALLSAPLPPAPSLYPYLSPSLRVHTLRMHTYYVCLYYLEPDLASLFRLSGSPARLGHV